jgi:hypothetical protein
MDFSLSSSLVGSAVLNPDKLALDLQFATDKSLKARKGPTPAFTRGSSATFVDSDGLIKYGAENLSLYSGQLVIGTGWSANATPSVTSIVDGLGPDSNNAYELTEIANTQSHVLFNTGGAGITGATSVVSGTTYTGSIFIKKVAGSVDWIQLTLGSVGFGVNQYASFNISNGIIGNSLGVNPEITYAGNGWYRCSISAVATATTTTTSNLFLVFTNNTDTTTRLLSYAGNTANKVLAAMCQFERSSTARTYIPTTTAAVYGPRFDHDPVTLACKGLLIEESRTNLVFPSDTLTTQTRTVTAVAHTLSFYGTGTVVLSGVAVATVTGTGAYPTRTTLTFTPTAGSLILTVTGSVTQAQLEAGSFATSYIPTVASSVVRSADVCSITGSDFSGFYNSLEGSLLTSVRFNSPITNTNAQALVDINDATTANRLRYFRNVTNGFPRTLNTSNSSINVDIIGSVALSPFVTQKFSIGFKANDYAFYVNTSQIGTDNLAALPISPTTLTIGNAGSGVTPQIPLNGTISSLRYFSKRLPNAKLQTLTV